MLLDLWRRLARKCRIPGTTLAKTARISGKATGLTRTLSNPAFMAKVLCPWSPWPVTATICVWREGRNLAKLRNEMTTIHVGHCQVDQHQVGPEYGRNVKRRRPAIGHMHLIAKFFNKQAKRVRAVPVVIDHENPKRFPYPWHPWHDFLSFARSHELSPAANRMSILPDSWASGSLFRRLPPRFAALSRSRRA